MTIAANIIKISEEEMGKVHGKSIEVIHLEVGQLSGLVIDSLRFALDVSKKEGVLKNARIVIDEIPGRLKCLNCGHNFDADDFFTCCPKCNMYKLDVLSGKEMIIKSITIR